jgi:hypothetical protein
MARRYGLGLATLRGMGDGTCQIPKAGVTMYYPPCPGYSAEVGSTPASSPAPSSAYDGGGSPSYQAPGDLETPENCDMYPGDALTACVNRNLDRQKRNMVRNIDAERDYFIEGCEHDWALNAQQYEALGMPVPPDNCQSKGYGLTYFDAAGGGTTGGNMNLLTPEQIAANTPQSGNDWLPGDGGVPIPSLPAGGAPASSSSPSKPAASSPASTSKPLTTAQRIANGMNPPASGSPAPSGGANESDDETAGKPNTALYWVLGIAVAGTLLHAAVTK